MQHNLLSHQYISINYKSLCFLVGNNLKCLSLCLTKSKHKVWLSHIYENKTRLKTSEFYLLWVPWLKPRNRPDHDFTTEEGLTLIIQFREKSSAAMEYVRNMFSFLPTRRSRIDSGGSSWACQTHVELVTLMSSGVTCSLTGTLVAECD